MTTEKPNPYASPATDASAQKEGLDPVVLEKVEAIIKDARQFWLAILMCIVCTGVGALIIGPWYLVRLIQWHSIANEEPMLLEADAVRGSLAQRFQSSKTKLIIGISFGAVMLLLVLGWWINLAGRPD